MAIGKKKKKKAGNDGSCWEYVWRKGNDSSHSVPVR